ncbi:MAG: inorganic phosphate transporter [Clostridia bacterium]|nr:inorganic phosphate transporter [Clostridia bacterium]
MVYITGIIILLLIFTNAITDAANAISTVVGTNVLPFRKAAYLSAIFNLVGIIVMCFINFSVAENMATIISFENGKAGIISILSAMSSVIIFALLAMVFGIPTSETHALIAGLTGSCIAFGNLENINWEEWLKVIIGLFWSIIGSYIVCKILKKIFDKKIEKFKKSKIEKYQILSSIGLSFMHGAQDGLKFIGIFIIYLCGIKNIEISSSLGVVENIWVILLVSSVMAIGVGCGGKKIVDNVGKNITVLSNTDAIITDIGTIITLFTASILGIPVSTTHCKTVSVISVGKNNNKIIVSSIIKAWIFTFPICILLGFLFSEFLMIFL